MKPLIGGVLGMAVALVIGHFVAPFGYAFGFALGAGCTMLGIVIGSRFTP